MVLRDVILRCDEVIGWSLQEWDQCIRIDVKREISQPFPHMRTQKSSGLEPGN
jgi:hypothetical protein